MGSTIYHLVNAPTRRGIKMSDDLVIEKNVFSKEHIVKLLGEEKSVFKLISDIVTEDCDKLCIKTNAGFYEFVKDTEWKSQLREFNKYNTAKGNVTLKCQLYWYAGSIRKISALINDIMDYVQKEFRYRLLSVSFDMFGNVTIEGSNDPLLD